MRIEVVGDRAISQQARTYAEYRFFAALAQLSETDKIRRVRAVLREVQSGRDCAGVACTVTVRLQGADSIRIRSVGSHAYAAINNAVDRLSANQTTATGNHLSI
jgi:ribosome-associated translation inhibitor RaiA